MTKNEVMLINYWFAIQKFQRLESKAESEWAKYIAQVQISNYETKYFELWFDMYRDSLQDRFVADMVEDGKDVEDIQVMLQWTRFVEWAMEKCFTYLNETK